MSIKKKIFTGLLLILSLCLLFFIVRSALFYQKIFVNKSPNLTQTPKDKTEYTIALLGYGGGNHEGTYLTDSIMLIHFNKEKKIALLISVPRDLWVRIPTSKKQDKNRFYTKINETYQMNFASCTYGQKTICVYKDLLYPNLDKKISNKEEGYIAKQILHEVTGLSIDNFVAVNFKSFVKFIDLIGGVDINVDRSFTDEQYPIEGKESELCGQEELFNQIKDFLVPGYNPTDLENVIKDKPELNEFLKNATSSPELAFPCRYEKLVFTAGLTHMDGVTALKYARSRHSPTDGGDFRRGVRQQKLVLAVKKKLLTASFIAKIPQLYQEFENDIRTDLSLSDLTELLGAFTNKNQYQIKNLILSDENFLDFDVSKTGQSILVPSVGLNNYSAIKKAISTLNQGLSLTPTPTLTLKPKKE